MMNSIYVLSRPIILITSALMVIIHVAGAYLGFRGLAIPRGVGVYVSIYESLYYILLSALILFTLPTWLTALTITMLITHIIGAYAYLKGYLSNYANPKTLRYYGIYESFELTLILIIIMYMIP